MTSAADPFNWGFYPYVVLGILISVALPILRGYLPKPMKFIDGDKPLWKVYLGTGLFSLLAAVVIMALAGDAIKTWNRQTALLAGFAWDSLLQKAVVG
jgi:hypothetical protein